MHEEYLDLDGELLDMQPPSDNVIDDDLAGIALGLQTDLADQMGLESVAPKFVSSLDEPPITPPADTPPANGGEGDGEGEGEGDQDDLISIILKSKGVNDPSRIRMSDEDGNVTEHNFNDLDYETQVNLLTSTEEHASNDLSDDEAQLIDYLRTNELTIEQLLEKQREAIIEELSDQVGKIDFAEISDEELYALEMQSSYNLSDEEVELALSKEQEHPELFAKKMNKLRADYKEAETERQQAELREIEERKQAEFTEFSEGLFDTAKSIDEIGGLTLSDQDRQDVLESILKPDADGVSTFTKLFNDKESFFKMAWFALKGKEAFEILHTHYKQVIEDSRKETSKKTKPTKLTFKGDVKGIPVRQQTPSKSTNKGEFNIEDFVQ